eukprot:COSAG06_NODE_38179_length_426_cov_0.978593_1_plen_76_part_10
MKPPTSTQPVVLPGGTCRATINVPPVSDSSSDDSMLSGRTRQESTQKARLVPVRESSGRLLDGIAAQMGRNQKGAA